MENATRASGVRAEMAGAPTPAEPVAAYAERREYFSRLRDHYNRSRYLWANLTVAAFIVAAMALAAWAFVGGWWLPVVGALGLALCAVAFVRQTRLDAIHRRYATLVTLCDQGLARLRRDWSHIDARPVDISGLPTLNAGDLDILGDASLQRLFNTVTTPTGQRRMVSWLLTPASAEVVRQRQAAARELAPRLELRDELTLFGALAKQKPDAQAAFLAWAEEPPWLPTRRWLDVYSVVSLVAMAALAVAQLTGLMPYPFWLVVLAANVVIAQVSGKEIERQVARVSEEQGAYLPYVGLFGYLGGQRFAADMLASAQAILAAESGAAEGALRSLARRMRFADVRLSVIGPALQLGLLWNVHSLRLLDGWRARHGRNARRWFEMLADLEALAGLGALTFDNPAWAFPTVGPDTGESLVATNLGHPLLPPDVCIGNDVTVGPPGAFLLVTGSNMSGKSTLLRAIGLNVALAQAGAPVCATTMRMPPVGLATSVRVEDSLAQGVSYFMAELKRLKVVVEEMRRVKESGVLPLFLLDEILSGTNSGERRIAARAILHSLLTLGATGAVSTHDLSLVEEPELRAASAPVHFTERFTRGPEGPAMTFDYRLRDGVATSVNALALMEIAGLPMEFARPAVEGSAPASAGVDEPERGTL